MKFKTQYKRSIRSSCWFFVLVILLAITGTPNDNNPIIGATSHSHLTANDAVVAETRNLGPSAEAVNQSQLWLDFAHPSSPHIYARNPDVPVSVPGLLQSSSDVTVSIPVLVVLMEWSDMTHRAVHDVPFWRDLVFADPRTGIRPSIAETYVENSNGRLLLVPALAGDTHDGMQDGVVGWVATSQSSTQLTDPSKKRAEGIRVADPSFDYNVYDQNNDGLITTNELLILVVFADNAATGASCDQHIGHANPPNCVQRPGGNTRATDPSQVDVDQNTGSPRRVYQYIAGVGEMAHEGVVAHEIGHATFGLGDLYPIDPNACTPYQQVTDGYYCSSVWYPPSPEDFSMMAYYWVDFVSHLDPWGKIHLGFVKPLVITHDGTYTIYDAETERSFSLQDSQPEAAIIYDPLRADRYKEYFILENRNNALLPDQGLAVWLIDENQNDMRKMIRLIRRGGHWAAMNQSLWDGVNNVDGYDLTATSGPRNSNWTNGSPSYIEIYDISQAGSAITFKVRIPPIFVDWSNTGYEVGSQTNPFNTLIEAVGAITEPPRTIRISGGSYPETMVIDIPCTLKGWRNGDAIVGQ